MKPVTLTCLTLTLLGGHVVGAKRKSRSNRERSKRNLIPYLESTDGVAPEGSRKLKQRKNKPKNFCHH